MIAVAGYINYTGSLGDIISIKNKNEDVEVNNEKRWKKNNKRNGRKRGKKF